MKKSEKEAQKRLKEIRDAYGDGYVVDKRGGEHVDNAAWASGTIKDGPIRRALGMKPKRVR